MSRNMLTDEHQLKLVTIFKQIHIYNKPNFRLFVEAGIGLQAFGRVE